MGSGGEGGRGKGGRGAGGEGGGAGGKGDGGEGGGDKGGGRERKRGRGREGGWEEGDRKGKGRASPKRVGGRTPKLGPARFHNICMKLKSVPTNLWPKCLVANTILKIMLTSRYIAYGNICN